MFTWIKNLFNKKPEAKEDHVIRVFVHEVQLVPEQPCSCAMEQALSEVEKKGKTSTKKTTSKSKKKTK